MFGGRSKRIYARNHIDNVTQADLRGPSADIYRGLFKFGVFNAVQSKCFDQVSVCILWSKFIAHKVHSGDGRR